MSHTTTALQRARDSLYAITGGSRYSGDARLARLTGRQRIDYFRSSAFIDWVADEKASGRQVFWLKDVDKTQAAGDAFVFFFDWRARNKQFSDHQLDIIRKGLLKRLNWSPYLGVRATDLGVGIARALGYGGNGPRYADLGPEEALRLWHAKERGGEGLDLLELWAIYWATQTCMTRAEKMRQVAEFAPLYAPKVYPDAKEDNIALTEAGVESVIVTNGDQELAIGLAPFLGIKPENVIGANMIYEGEHATGEMRSYEIFGEEWARRPQPGKALSFHLWAYLNRQRFGWADVDEDFFVIGGRDGDSASSDGGMMMFLQAPAIGNFMINTPGEPERLVANQRTAMRHGWAKGKYFTLDQQPSASGRFTDE